MARTAQLTFEQRIARIEQKVDAKARHYPKGSLLKSGRKKRGVRWDLLVFGAMLGGGVGTLFAMSVGLDFVLSLDQATLIELFLTDYLTAALIAGVAIAPIGFVLSQFFARSNPGAWQFWMAYLAAVLGCNSTELQVYYHAALAAAGQ